ncbi:MAG: patatin-like phospholipase family protein, partial [Microgenomates group bacterium]
MVERGGRVTNVIRERIESGSQPGYRQDNFKIGAVIEGGCMRGAVSGGETLGLCALGLLPAFDAVYGVSAGAAAGSYLIAQQAEAVSIYFENVNNEFFFDLRRILIGQPAVDISYLTHTVMKEIRTLDWKKVITSPISLHIFVTSATDAKSVDLTKFSSQEELLFAIHCSCRMPIIAGKPLQVAENIHYTDGGVSTGGGLALEEAIADGCTHL